MSIEIPGTLFEQFHSGFRVTFAHVEGAGSRICIEDPKRRVFLSFRLEKQNERKLYDCLCQSYRDAQELGLPETKPLASDGKR